MQRVPMAEFEQQLKRALGVALDPRGRDQAPKLP